MPDETPYIPATLNLDEPLTLEFLTRASTIFPDLHDYLNKNQKEIKIANVAKGGEEKTSDEGYRQGDEN